jgi:hypothetical protein
MLMMTFFSLPTPTQARLRALGQEVSDDEDDEE